MIFLNSGNHRLSYEKRTPKKNGKKLRYKNFKKKPFLTVGTIAFHQRKKK